MIISIICVSTHNHFKFCEPHFLIQVNEFACVGTYIISKAILEDLEVTYQHVTPMK